MTQPATLPSERDGMDNSSSPERRALPSLSRPLPLSESETEVGFSAPTSTRSSFEQVRSADSKRTSFPLEPLRSTGPRDVILKAFLPRVAVYASQDTEELVRLKGIYGGLCGLLRPFGENVPGKVGIRDSVGVSKSWEDYGVYFVPFERGQSTTAPSQHDGARVEDSIQEGDWSRILKAAPEQSQVLPPLDEVTRLYLDNHRFNGIGDDDTGGASPEYYNHFLRKLLSDRPLSPHDTFSHPVACIIAISSSTADPIPTLGDLYHNTRSDSGNLPPWVHDGFLRYYVLVHDEDHDDLTASTNLFAQMKRHFGLHCHMLRLRGIECTGQNTDESPLPATEWLSAEEDMALVHQCQDAAAGELQQYIFDSDAAFIKTFVRELVTQSVVPYMENRVTTWNDQVASKRKGVTGRLMSMSKRWTGFGSVRGRNSPTGAADKDYDATQGAYKPDSSVAIMHRLADYAFMLRDWTLSSSIYDFLRSDFKDDKAWSHYAEAHEMEAASLLLTGQSSTSRGRIENINQLLDTASYSFITRCGSPREASRCMIVAMELYINNGGLGGKEASRWGKRLLELFILSPSVQVLIAERMAVACRYRSAFIDLMQPSPIYRRSALWSLLASESWIRTGRAEPADIQFSAARSEYESCNNDDEFGRFEGTQRHFDNMAQKISDMGLAKSSTDGQEPDTFIEDLAPPPTSHANSEQTPGHRHTASVAHRRAMSQHNVLSAIGRQDGHLQAADDGFS